MKSSSSARGRAPADPVAEPRARSGGKGVDGASAAAAANRTPTAAVADDAAAKDGKGRRNGLRKPKLVRDSFTFPAADHARLGELKERALKSGREIKKSELLRAGLAALVAMPDAAFLAALDGVERIKTGRPAK